MIDVAALRAADEEVDWDLAAHRALASGRRRAALAEPTPAKRAMRDLYPAPMGLSSGALISAMLMSVAGLLDAIKPGSEVSFWVFTAVLWALAVGGLCGCYLHHRHRPVDSSPLLVAPEPVHYTLRAAPTDDGHVVATLSRTVPGERTSRQSVRLDEDTAAASEQFAALSQATFALEQAAHTRWQRAMTHHGLDAGNIDTTAAHMRDEAARAHDARVGAQALAQTLTSTHAAGRQQLLP